MMEVNVNKCRVCLKVERSNKLSPLFDEKSGNVERIFLLTGIIVDKGDDPGIPDKVCKKCQNALIAAVNIRGLCIDSDNRLREQTKDIKAEYIPEAPVHFFVIKSEFETFHDEHLHPEDEFKTTEKDVEDLEDVEDHEKEETCNEKEEKDIEELEKFSTSSSSSENLLDSFQQNASPEVKTKCVVRRNQTTVCDVCGKSVKGNYIFTHRQTHSEYKQTDFHCDLCGKSFVVKPYLFSHMLNLHMGKKFKCKLCGKKYSKKSPYEHHLRGHTDGRRIFSCTFKGCTKSYSRKANAEIHMRVHTNSRPYLCSVCGRGFIHYTDHKRHEMGHTGIRPHKCSHEGCSRGFIKRSELTAHQKSHS